MHPSLDASVGDIDMRGGRIDRDGDDLAETLDLPRNADDQRIASEVDIGEPFAAEVATRRTCADRPGPEVTDTNSGRTPTWTGCPAGRLS